MEKWELDVRVLLNNNTYVNMEMQVLNHGNWPERSLQYLDLTCIELATEEDKNRHTDRLAKLFKATTWEEINMLATNNRHEDLQRACADEDFLRALLDEYHI